MEQSLCGGLRYLRIGSDELKVCYQCESLIENKSLPFGSPNQNQDVQYYAVLAEVQTKISLFFLLFFKFLINLLARMRSSISNITQNRCEVCSAHRKA